jgi:hypothetical protein
MLVALAGVGVGSYQLSQRAIGYRQIAEAMAMAESFDEKRLKSEQEYLDDCRARLEERKRKWLGTNPELVAIGQPYVDEAIKEVADSQESLDHYHRLRLIYQRAARYPWLTPPEAPAVYRSRR